MVGIVDEGICRHLDREIIVVAIRRRRRMALGGGTEAEMIAPAVRRRVTEAPAIRHDTIVRQERRGVGKVGTAAKSRPAEGPVIGIGGSREILGRIVGSRLRLEVIGSVKRRVGYSGVEGGRLAIQLGRLPEGLMRMERVGVEKGVIHETGHEGGCVRSAVLGMNHVSQWRRDG